MFKKLLYLAALLVSTNASQASVHYVKSTGAGAQDGSSWSNASNDIQAMINIAAAGDQIWVANGTYLPTHLANNTATISLNNRNNAFVLKANVQLYGGFSGAETLATQRDSTSLLTVLSGDLGISGDSIDNAYHVMIASGNLGTASLNSFAIRWGQADGSDSIMVNGNNILQMTGGGIACYGTALAVVNSLVDSNSGIKGAGMYNYQSTLTVSRDMFRYNSGVALLSGGSGKSGAIYNEQSTLSITICNISRNTAGGIMNHNAAGTISGSTIVRNIVGISNDSSSPVIMGCTISLNFGIGAGGGIRNTNYSSPVVTNCTFERNTSQSSGVNYTDYYGGGIYNDNHSSPSFTDCNIYANFIGGSNLNLYGGGIYNGNFSAPTFTNCSISNCGLTAIPTSYGGAICNDLSSAPVFNKCTIVYNVGTNGGAVYNSRLSAAVFNNCWIVDNGDFDTDGGAVYNDSSSSIFKNCVITGNTANRGAVYNKNSSSPVFTNCTITNNQSNIGSGGIWQYGGDVKINNSIIWGNASGDGVYLADGTATFTAKHSLIEGQNSTADGNIAGTVNPMLASVLLNNYNLLPGSPCINTGADSLYTGNLNTDLDFEGKFRLIDTSIDMGAVEYCGGHPVITTQPVSRFCCLNGTTTFSIAVSNSTGFSFQWQKGGVDIPGATAMSYTVSNVSYSDSGAFQVVMSGSACGKFYSAFAYLTVKSPAKITQQPTDTTLCAGSNLRLSTTTNVLGLSYQWLKDGGMIAGATDSIFVVVNAQLADSGKYILTVKDSCGNADTSRSAIVSINPAVAPVVSISSNQGDSVLNGQSVIFTSSVVNGGAAPQYQWKKNGTNIPAATNDTYNAIANADFQSNDQISLSVKNTDACGVVSVSTTILMYVHTSSTGVINAGNNSGHFSLYPNPNDGSFTIKGVAEGLGTVTLEVYNMLGQNVYNEEVPVDNGQLNKKLNLEKSLPSGNYFLKINGVGTTVIRFTINRN
ncbi:right-handed parallel beta-helix repeat-containing protein [Taibaiella soli]|uniref:Ig-like domain-containing protein n=1 Tax=Taibaiella soli TaxID=1649169 RepID=A0A2W2AMZ4_9BACT|nr:right-handed parallel beta-helix repeat-containing protein [Taibaiella soli]PZF73700.1 hypothetical protein DN068_06805 [Taibaiella soli]